MLHASLLRTTISPCYQHVFSPRCQTSRYRNSLLDTVYYHRILPTCAGQQNRPASPSQISFSSVSACASMPQLLVFPAMTILFDTRHAMRRSSLRPPPQLPARPQVLLSPHAKKMSTTGAATPPPRPTIHAILFFCPGAERRGILNFHILLESWGKKTFPGI